MWSESEGGWYMERLTRWNDQTESAELTAYDDFDWKQFWNKELLDVVDFIRLREAFDKLAEYEDLEEQVMKSTGVDIASMVGEFMHYCNLKKEGRLVELPCKPETKLYWLSDEGYGYEPIEEIEAVDFVYNGYSLQMFFADKDEKNFLPLPVEGIGNELFFTRKEAEAALKEMVE